jgi:hypothetical protein
MVAVSNMDGFSFLYFTGWLFISPNLWYSNLRKESLNSDVNNSTNINKTNIHRRKHVRSFPHS